MRDLGEPPLRADELAECHQHRIVLVLHRAIVLHPGENATEVVQAAGLPSFYATRAAGATSRADTCRSRRMILPLVVFGRSSMMSTVRGYL